MSLFRSKTRAISLANSLAESKPYAQYVYKVGKKYEITYDYRGEENLVWASVK